MAAKAIDTVVMSGGAPMSPLMAGFLFALWKDGKTFKNFHTSGAGALMALLSISPPKGVTPGKALEDWADTGVADEIYRNLPVNFKLFHKPGPFSPVFQRLAQRFKIPVAGQPASAQEGTDTVKELFVDWLATPAHDNPTRLDILRRLGNPLEQMHAALRTLWLKDPTRGRAALARRPDPVKRARDKWLTSLLDKPDDQRLYNDLVDLFFSALTPSTLTNKSQGLAAPLPFLESVVDFDTLDANVRALGGDGHLCVNAYNMTKDARERPQRAALRRDALRRAAGARSLMGKIKARRDVQRQQLGDVMELFESPRPKGDRFRITPQGIRAAFSMPFIYPPAQIGDDFYSEGADHEPINFHLAHLEQHAPTGPVVLLDVLKSLEDYLVRRPRDLWDAYVISIMTPVVALASTSIAEFREDNPNIALIPEEGESLWDIPPETQPFVMDWSRSNLQTLFRVGEEAGRKFLLDCKRGNLELAPHPRPFKAAARPRAPVAKKNKNKRKKE